MTKDMAERNNAERKKITAWLLCFILFWAVCCPLTAGAAESEQKTVRVGYYVNECFQEGASDEDVKSGYGYEYLRKVACYTGWKYEYVYGKWADLYEQFLSGDIDIMAGVSRLEEREDFLLFPEYEMGIEGYYLYKHEHETEIISQDPTSLSGKKIGAIKNTTMADSLHRWLAEHPVDAEVIEFDGFEAEQAAFDRGEIDAFVEMDFNISTGSGRTPVIKVGQLPYYLAVTNKRPELLVELNAAIATLNEVEPYFRQNLQYANYRNSLVSHMLSEPEQAWVREHAVIHVGYFDEYLPYCGSDRDGNASGLMTDVLAEILRKLDIADQAAIRYSAYHSYEEMIADLHTGELDLAFPVGAELWNAEQDRIFASSPVVSAGVDLAFAGSYDANTLSSIAVNRNNKLQRDYTASNFPDAQIVFCNSVNDCLDAVLRGEAGSTILNGIRTNSLLSESKYSTMVAIQLSRTDDFCFGVDEGNDDLLLLLNRGMKLIGEDYGINASHKYMIYQYTAADFVRENALLILVLIASIAAVILFLLVREERNRKRYTAQIEKSRNELEDAFQAAKEASQAKSTFLFNMSHDIRTPMNAIIGFTALLKGTKFTLTLSHPTADAADAKFESEHPDEYRIENFAGKRILLAEDNELNAEIAMTVLEEEGFLVEHAEDGKICVDMLQKAAADYYDLILMDIQMPNIDGYKATRIIRRLPDQRKADIPIIAMTANAFEEDRKNAFRMGMNGHISKPMRIETLKSTLCYVLSKKEEDREIYRSWHEYFGEYEAFNQFKARYNRHGSECGCLVYEARDGEKILFADEAMIRIFGCSNYMEFCKFVGGSFKNLVHPDDIQRVEQEITNQIYHSEDSLDRVRYRILRKDGAVRVVDDIGRKVFTENGGSVFYVCIVDVTDRPDGE